MISCEHYRTASRLPSGRLGGSIVRHKFLSQPDGLRQEFGGGGGNRTHVRGTSIAGFSVCSRLFHLIPRSVSWQPSARPARKISIAAVGRDGNPARLASSTPDRRAEPRGGRGYLRSQSVAIVGSYSCLHPIYERVALDTLPTAEIVPRRTQYAPKLDSPGHSNRPTAC